MPAAPGHERVKQQGRIRGGAGQRTGDHQPGGIAALSPAGTSPRPGFSPTRPQAAAGMRTEPPPSLPGAKGTSPAATAAALPPEEPPELRLGA